MKRGLLHGNHGPRLKVAAEEKEVPMKRGLLPAMRHSRIIQALQLQKISR